MKRARGAHLTPGRTILDWTFQIGLVLKGLDGALELIGGLLLLVMTPDQISSLLRALTQHELSEDPEDLIAGLLVHFANTLTVSVSLISAVYLLLHGLVKVVLVWAVLSNHLWAYPWMIAFLLFFIIFQAYQLWTAFSWAIFWLTVFDVFIVWLTWREYRSHRALRSGAQNAKRHR